MKKPVYRGWVGLGNQQGIERRPGDSTLGLEGQTEGVFSQTQGELWPWERHF